MLFRSENLMKFLDRISLLDLDVVVCPGDFTDFTIPKGFSRLDVCKIILEELKGLNKPILAVPGSWDGDLIEFLKKEKEWGVLVFRVRAGQRPPSIRHSNQVKERLNLAWKSLIMKLKVQI